MKTLHTLSMLLLSVAAAAPAVAQPAPALVADTVGRIDGMALGDLVASTAGDVQPKMIAKYGGDFAAYWKAASSSLEGKTFEAVVAATSNGRLRATGDGTRLVPSALLGRPGDAADLLVVNAGGHEVGRVQAKLGAAAVIDALDDPKYASMSVVTTQESYDGLLETIRDEEAQALRRGRAVKPSVQRLANAVESGRVWRRLPCGAPLPERTHVSTVAEGHFRGRWDEVGRTFAITQDDAIRGAAGATRRAGRAAASSADEAARAAGGLDDVVILATGTLDDVGRTAGKTLAKAVVPVAVGLEIGMSALEIQDTETRFASGAISQRQREVQHAQVVGGVGGSWAGGTGGAAAGAAAGTLVLPGVGTAVGAVVGGMGGAIGGSAAGRYAAGLGVDAMHGAGITLHSSATWAGTRITRGYRWATRW